MTHWQIGLSHVHVLHCTVGQLGASFENVHIIWVEFPIFSNNNNNNQTSQPTETQKLTHHERLRRSDEIGSHYAYFHKLVRLSRASVHKYGFHATLRRFGRLCRERYICASELVDESGGAMNYYEQRQPACNEIAKERKKSCEWLADCYWSACCCCFFLWENIFS